MRILSSWTVVRLIRDWTFISGKEYEDFLTLNNYGYDAIYQSFGIASQVNWDNSEADGVLGYVHLLSWSFASHLTATQIGTWRSDVWYVWPVGYTLKVWLLIHIIHIVTLSSGVCIPTVTQNYYTQGFVDASMIAIWLSPYDPTFGSSGLLVFGGIEASYPPPFNGSLPWQ